MPEKRTLERAMKDQREGKAPTTQAGEFVREEIEHVREGKHGARSTKQAIAIGLSKARRAGVDLAPPKKGEASEKTRASARRAVTAGKNGDSAASPRRSRAITKALKREPHAAASKQAGPPASTLCRASPNGSPPAVTKTRVGRSGGMLNGISIDRRPSVP